MAIPLHPVTEVEIANIERGVQKQFVSELSNKTGGSSALARLVMAHDPKLKTEKSTMRAIQRQAKGDTPISPTWFWRYSQIAPGTVKGGQIHIYGTIIVSSDERTRAVNVPFGGPEVMFATDHPISFFESAFGAQLIEIGSFRMQYSYD